MMPDADLYIYCTRTNNNNNLLRSLRQAQPASPPKTPLLQPEAPYPPARSPLCLCPIVIENGAHSPYIGHIGTLYCSSSRRPKILRNIWKCCACNPQFIQSLLALFPLHHWQLKLALENALWVHIAGLGWRKQRERHVSLGVASLSQCHQKKYPYFCGRLYFEYSNRRSRRSGISSSADGVFSAAVIGQLLVKDE